MIISTHVHFGGPPLACTIHLLWLSAGARDAAEFTNLFSAESAEFKSYIELNPKKRVWKMVFLGFLILAAVQSKPVLTGWLRKP